MGEYPLQLVDDGLVNVVIRLVVDGSIRLSQRMPQLEFDELSTIFPSTY